MFSYAVKKLLTAIPLVWGVVTLIFVLVELSPGPLELREGLEQLRALEHGLRIAVAEVPEPLLSVDVPEDLDRVRERLESGTRTASAASVTRR